MWTITGLTEALVRPTAECHIACWREAYRGLVPDHVLDALDVDRLADRWDRWRTGPNTIVVAVEDADVVGFAHSNAETLFALYVRRTYYGTGLADALITLATGERACELWVLDGNARAQAFYRRQGFGADGTAKWDPIVNAQELRMVRPDIVAS